MTGPYGDGSSRATRKSGGRSRQRRGHPPPVCEFCHRSFSRHEHLQRHLRTHTNDRPFSCQMCSKSFNRRDLMTRHKRLMHASSQTDEVEGNDVIHIPDQPGSRFEGHSNRTATDTEGQPAWSNDNAPSAPATFDDTRHISLIRPKPGRSANQNDTPQTNPPGQWREVASNSERGEVDDSRPFCLIDSIDDPMQDFTGFLESIGMSEHWFPDIPPSVESGLMPGDEALISSVSHNNDVAPEGSNANHNFAPRAQFQEEEPLSNFGSRMPSLHPETCESPDTPVPLVKPSSIYTIHTADHQSFLQKLAEFQHILPVGFTPPSAYSLSRFLDGFLDGLNQHLPFVHAPTLSIASCSPALTLALAACGSHYRFEQTRGRQLFHAGRAILLELLRRAGLFESATRSGFSDVTLEPQLNYSLDGEPDDPIEVIQTLSLLTIFATWSHNTDILQGIVLLQGTLAHMVRKHGLQDSGPHFDMKSSSDLENWILWARQERARRTKLVVYTFLNFYSVLHNTPPVLLSSDIELDLPCSTDLWVASDPIQWRCVWDAIPDEPVPFQRSLALLFSPVEGSSNREIPSTPLGNHALLHAMFQQLYFARQLCRYPLMNKGVSLGELTTIEDALTSWKSRWKETRESSTNPRNPAGPIAFTSVAMLGQIYVRLQVDLGPHRALLSNDPLQVARALNAGPPVMRNSGLVTALLHAAHGLSIPIRLGVDFVARTYSFYWSVQHSLSALEYAFLLTRWLLTLPVVGISGMSKHEQKILLWITHLMDETDTRIETPSSSRLATIIDEARMRQLSVGIVRVWARTFQGNTCWELVNLIGASLKAYADMLEAS